MSERLRQNRLRALSTATVILGLLLVLQNVWSTAWPNALGLGLVVLGCAVRPLQKGVKVLRSRLDEQAVRNLADLDLDVLGALLYEGRQAKAETVREAAAAQSVSLPLDEVHGSLPTLVSAGLVYEEVRPSGSSYGVIDPPQALALLEAERERRLAVSKPGSRSRLSDLAERLSF